MMKPKRWIHSVLSLSLLCGVSASAIETQVEEPQSETLFAAKNSTEAVMSFSHWVLLKSRTRPTQAEVQAQIEAQLQHLFGPMSAARFPGVPKADHRLTAVRVENASSGTYKISYSYTGTAVIGLGAQRTYELILPNDPTAIYAAGRVGRGYPCTDSHYQSEGDFWYFWNPYQSGCPLKANVDYTVVRASIRRLDNSSQTYPEYDRLVGTDGKIRISVLLGMDSPSNEKDPNRSRDVNADNYRGMKRDLERLGFIGRRLSNSELMAVIPRGTSPQPFVEEFEKRNTRGTIVVRLFFGPTGIDESSKAFHYFFKDALANSAVLIYDGHSGLGGHLDVASIEQIEGFKLVPNKSKYQIYFFNSCTSYTYYNTMFFNLKASASDRRGTKNLDIMTNGLETAFAIMHDTNIAIIKAIDQWSNNRGAASYQKLAETIDSDNLFNVNGDEDNPTTFR